MKTLRTVLAFFPALGVFAILTLTCIHVAPCSAQDSPPLQDSEMVQPDGPRDTVVLLNGKTFVGIIQTESETTVGMIVFVGAMKAETTIDRKDIRVIKRDWVDPSTKAQSSPQSQSGYVKPQDVVLVTPILVRASAVALNIDRSSPKGAVAHGGEASLVGYISCPDFFAKFYVPGRVLEPGEVARFNIEGVVRATAQTTLKDQSRIQYLIARRAVDYEADFRNMELRFYAVHRGVILEGRLCRERPSELAPSPGKCPADQYERQLLIEWRQPAKVIGTNALLLTMFGPTHRALAAQFDAAAARSQEEIDAVDDLLSNGIPIGCSHCGGDGELTGADSSRFSYEEAEEYQRRISAFAAGAGNGFSKSRIVVSCRSCRGSGIASHKKPSGELMKRSMEYKRIHERFLQANEATAKQLLEQVRVWQDNPSGGPDLAEGRARVLLAEESLRRTLEDAPRSREVLEEIKRLLRDE
ncbi:MAG: hypothetical protein KGS45_03295 [Planctomycetes bacterium]|nr:hypothetical protein [Planctomycetota bacterium]